MTRETLMKNRYKSQRSMVHLNLRQLQPVLKANQLCALQATIYYSPINTGTCTQTHKTRVEVTNQASSNARKEVVMQRYEPVISPAIPRQTQGALSGRFAERSLITAMSIIVCVVQLRLRQSKRGKSQQGSY